MVIKLRKQIQEYGNTAVIKIFKEDKRIYDIQVGDMYDIELKKIEGKKEEDNG